MFKYLIPAVLACAGLLCASDSVQAQKGGGGGRGGPAPGKIGGGPGNYHPPGNRAPGNLPPGNYHPGNYSGGRYNGFGIYFGVNPAPLRYDYYPPLYTPYVAPRYSYYPDSYYPAPTYPIDPSPIPVPAPVPAPDLNTATIATVRVLVPDPQAKVWFDGALMTQAGTNRLYQTPPLSPGTYTFRVRASWTEGGTEMVQEQEIRVTPGQTTVADFSKPFSEPLPLPK